MNISKKYLIVLTDENAPEKQIEAVDENKNPLFNLQIRASKSGKPFYLDVSRLKGRSISFLAGGKEFVFDGETDRIPSFYSCALRPKLHYTVPYGWLNDPNGLIFFGGKYHIFCQHNPLGTAWGNMHWHHSTTVDFIHFENLGDALFPDDMGTVFSGSAVCDKNNVSGLGKNALLLYYTIAEYQNSDNAPRFSQGLAYSTDGKRFKKYAENPVVANIRGENRDPKVVFVPEMNAYVMALYLDSDEYCLLKSENLLKWEIFQNIHISGDGECPDLFYLESCKKWVLSGASDYYLVGRFDENGFVCEQEPLRFYRELNGKKSYAAQTFSNTQGRALKMSWENINPNNGRFCGQLSVPFEMSLITLPDGKMRLKASLCREIEGRLKRVSSDESIGSSYIADIRFESDCKLDIDGTSLEISIKDNRISYGEKSIPLTFSGEHNMRIIADKMSVEILADGGLIFSCMELLCRDEKRSISVRGGNADISLFRII